MIKVYCDVCGEQVVNENQLELVNFQHFTYSYMGDRYDADDRKMCCKKCREKYYEALAEFNNVYWKTHIEKSSIQTGRGDEDAKNRT